MPQKKKDPTVREVTVHFVRRFPLLEKICPVCKQKFRGTKKARYDKLACRQKANYERHAEKYRQEKLERYHARRQSPQEKLP